jgi:defect-in-organelle-trafficking protein DotD
MIKTAGKSILAVGLLALLSACSSQPTPQNVMMSYITTDSAPAQTTDADAQSQLSQAAGSVAQSLQELSAIQHATHPQAQLAPPIDPAKIGMAQQASLDWTGPIEPLMQKIAKASGYKLSIIGQQPSIPIVVSISIHNEPLATILRDAIYQAESQATVSVYPRNKIIELRYISK